MARRSQQGVVDVLGSDHAPHTLEEKARPYPASPSGMPGVQTLVPVMLTHVAEGRLTLERFVDLTSRRRAAHLRHRRQGPHGGGLGRGPDHGRPEGPPRASDHADMATRSGWTPFDGMEAKGWPMATIIRGRVVMRDGEILAPGGGEPVRFQETL